MQQIELALERWRWLPDVPPARYAVVNIPGFRLLVFAHDSMAAHPLLEMSVIVGQAAGRHGTAIFTGSMDEVVFRPFWDVPPSIARKELIPRIRHNVYLHGTPAQELFARTRRDFSQPCIRIANPVGLAELVLRGQARWDRAAIDSAMAGDRTIHVHVDDPMAVFILYVTAVAAADGTVHFYPDLYRHDAALARALERAKVADDRGPAAPDGDDRTRTL